MRFVWTIGRLTIFDFTLFKVDEPSENADVVVVHHYNDDEEKPDGPDLFGGNK